MLEFCIQGITNFTPSF
jgi:hypothetical protein